MKKSTARDGKKTTSQKKAKNTSVDVLSKQSWEKRNQATNLQKKNRERKTPDQGEIKENVQLQVPVQEKLP